MPEMKQDRIALDRAGSVRTISIEGHLHVSRSNISKANVCEYYGAEIPEAEALNLDPRRRYRLLRDPVELEAGAATFNGKPLLIVHKPQTADGHDHELVVGAIANPEWAAPFVACAAERNRKAA